MQLLLLLSCLLGGVSGLFQRLQCSGHHQVTCSKTQQGNKSLRKQIPAYQILSAVLPSPSSYDGHTEHILMQRPLRRRRPLSHCWGQCFSTSAPQWSVSVLCSLPLRFHGPQLAPGSVFLTTFSEIESPYSEAGNTIWAGEKAQESRLLWCFNTMTLKNLKWLKYT